MSKDNLKKCGFIFCYVLVLIFIYIGLIVGAYFFTRWFDSVKNNDNSNIVLNDDNLYKMDNSTYSQGQPLYFYNLLDDYVDFNSSNFIGGPFAEGTGYYQCFTINSDYLNSYLNLDTDLQDYNPYIRITTQYQLEVTENYALNTLNGSLINIRGFCFVSNSGFNNVSNYEALYNSLNATFLYKYIVDTSIISGDYINFGIEWLFDLKPYLNSSNQLPDNLYFNFSLLKRAEEETETYYITPIDSRWILADMLYSNTYSYGNEVDILQNQNSTLQNQNSTLQAQLTQLQTSYNSLDYNYTTLLGQYNTLLNQTDYSFSELFWSLSAVPFGLLTSAFNVQVMGVNLRGIISGLFTAALLIWLFKKFFK